MGFTIPQLETCCCGCSLRTGTKIIGWLALIGSIMMIVISGSAYAALTYAQDHPADATPESKALMDQIPAIKAVLIFLCIVYLINTALSLMLLMGAYQNKARLVYIWVLVSLTTAAVELITNVVQLLVTHNPGVIGNFLYFIIDMYFILVVYSFYREIQGVSNYA